MNNKESLEIARKSAWSKNKKMMCKFCGVERRCAFIIRHEDSCHLNPKNIFLCMICGKPVKKNYSNTKTCSYACSNTYFRSGLNHWNWKEDSYRTTCFMYHNKKCIICDEKNIVEVHHLDENSKNNDPRNLIPLCPTHHQYWHSRYKYIIQDKVEEYIKQFVKKFRV